MNGYLEGQKDAAIQSKKLLSDGPNDSQTSNSLTSSEVLISKDLFPLQSKMTESCTPTSSCTTLSLADYQVLLPIYKTLLDPNPDSRISAHFSLQRMVESSLKRITRKLNYVLWLNFQEIKDFLGSIERDSTSTQLRLNVSMELVSPVNSELEQRTRISMFRMV